jgi:hypothetical protein
MADGPYYVDSKGPWLVVSPTAVTLATTDKAIVPSSQLPLLGSNYWYVGKTVRLRAFGHLTTGTTPGNGTWDIYWGSGADATGTIIASSAAFALTASQTTLTFELEAFITCRAVGSGTNGSLLTCGVFSANVAVVASTLQPVMIPASAPGTAVGIDTTAANFISPQFKRSGSTAEAVQVHSYMFESLN